MTSKLRSLYLALAFSLTLTGASYAFPEWTQGVGLDFWNESQLQIDLNVANRRGRDLDDGNRTITQRLEYREVVMQDLFAGRIDFREATARFRFLCETQPDAMRLVKSNFEGDNLDDMVARQVWNFACVRMKQHADREASRDRLLNQAGELLSADYVARVR